MSFPLLPDIASRSRRFQLGETSETVPSLGVFRTSARAATRCAPLRSARRRPGSCDAPERARVRPALALPASGYRVPGLWFGRAGREAEEIVLLCDCGPSRFAPSREKRHRRRRLRGQPDQRNKWGRFPDHELANESITALAIAECWQERTL